MKVHSIAIADPPIRSSYGLHAPYALRNILEIKSDDGITGIAETYGGEAPAKPAQIDEAIQAQIMDTGKVGDIYYGLSDGTVQNYEKAQRDAKLLNNAINLRLRAGESISTATESAARDLFGDVLRYRNSYGLLSEDVHPVTEQLWGNFPQTYSMAGLILTGMRLSRSWEDRYWRASS